MSEVNLDTTRLARDEALATLGRWPRWLRRVDVARLAVRVGVGLVFVLLGLDKLQEPGRWAMFVPVYVPRLVSPLMPVSDLLRLQGACEVVVGGLLVLGLAARSAASLAAALLVAIVHELGLDDIGARDVGLFGGSLSVAIEGPGRCSLDWLLRKRRSQAFAATRLWPRAWPFVASGVIAAGVIGVVLTRSIDASDREELRRITANALVDPRLARLPIPPLPAAVDADPVRVDLGRKLFHEPRLSRDGTVSCATCHALDKGGADGRRHAVGIDGQVGDLNTPTVLNAALNFKQFWDGRADDLEQQAEGPIINPKEMAASWDDVLAFLQRDGEYSDLFRRAFADGVTKANVTAAIAEYERTLVTPDSPFDRSLKGDEGALSPMQKRGYERFVALGCISCHQGANVGGNTFQTMGKMEDYFAGREVREADLGRFNVTKNPADKFKFKVPSLRTAALTAPYFHDGSAETLEEAVDTMARYQLGLRLEEAETAEIVAFLQSLTGRVPTE